MDGSNGMKRRGGRGYLASCLEAMAIAALVAAAAVALHLIVFPQLLVGNPYGTIAGILLAAGLAFRRTHRLHGLAPAVSCSLLAGAASSVMMLFGLVNSLGA